jgi:hypothetical protein
MAAKASSASTSGTVWESQFSVAAESFGQEVLSCSQARAPAAMSTRSTLSERATARRFADSRSAKCGGEERASSPQIFKERAMATRPTPIPIRHPTYALFWGRYQYYN